MTALQQTLDELLTLEGALASAVVDAKSGMLMAKAGSGMDMELAAAGNTEVVRAKLKTMKSLALNDVIEDMLITLGKQYHIIRPMVKHEGVFLYYVLDKVKANLALARRKLQDAEANMVV